MGVVVVVSGCSFSAKALKEYRRRHDKVWFNIHWVLCKKYGVKECERWYEHKFEPAIEYDIVKILWNVCIHVHIEIERRSPDIVVMGKNNDQSLMIDVVSTLNNNLILKRNKNLDNYSELLIKIRRMCYKETLIVE